MRVLRPALLIAILRRTRGTALQIDHDPNEPKTRGQMIAVTVVTSAIMIALGLSLRWLESRTETATFVLSCCLIVAVAFAIAFWMDRKR